MSQIEYVNGSDLDSLLVISLSEGIRIPLYASNMLHRNMHTSKAMFYVIDSRFLVATFESIAILSINCKLLI